MTRYFTQWDSDTIGSTIAGWTHRTAATAPTYVPAYGTPAVKRRYLAHASGQSGELRGLITWDAIDSDANRAKCNLLTCISVDAFTAGTADLWARVAVTGTTITDGYRLRLVSGGGAGSFTLSKRVASVTTSGFASASPTISAGKSYFIRFDLNGTALKAKIWDAALGMAGEPLTWDISTTDSGVSAAGYVGLAMNATAGTVVPWNFFAVGTNGDSAVCPRTNAEYTAWLGSQVSLRCVLAELSATGYDSGGSPYTKTVNWYISNHPFTSAQQDTPSGKHYDAVITGIPAFRREMSSALSGAAQTGFGDLIVTNPATTQAGPGTRDDILRMRWNRNYLKLYLGDPTWPKHDFRLIVLGQLKQPTAPTESSVRFPITDVIDILSGRFQSNRFSAGPHQGKQLPYICGNPIAMEALETGTGLEFRLHDGAMAQLSDVWDDGVSLTGAHSISAVDAGTDTITSSTPHGLAVDSRVYYITTPPAPLTTGVYYYVKTVPSTTTYTLAATRGGATINITATTTGGVATTFNWWEDLSNGKITLVASPAGRVYVKLAAHETIGGDLNKLSRVLADAIFTKGAISLNFKDSTSFTQLNTDLANSVGMVVYDEPVSVQDVVSRLCAGANCWYGATTDGLIQAGRIALPSSTVVMSFTESDVENGSLRMVEVILPINRATSAVRTARVWDANGPQNLAAFKDGFLIRRYYTEVGSAWPSAGIPLDDRPNRSQVADFPMLETVFSSDAETPTETTRRETLYGVKLGIFEFETRLPASQLNIGETISLTYPRMGWKNYTGSDDPSPDNTADYDATKAVVIGIDTDIARGRVKLKVFRRIPGYYPTTDLN